MNNIEKLIKELCPNGVEWKELGGVAKIEIGKQLNRTLLFDNGTYPVQNGGIEPSGFYDEYNTDENTITISQGGASAGFVNFITDKFWAGAHCYVIKETDDVLLYKYVYYVLKNGQMILQNSKLGAGIPGLNRSTLSKFHIPIPPLPIQQEIVNILDKFTALEAELQAELDARRKQYEYYREKLLTFTPPHLTFDNNNNKIEWKTLGEIGQLIRGNGLQKKDFTDEGIGCIHYGQIYTYYGSFTDTTISFVSLELANTLKKVEMNDLIITNTSENVEDVCKTIAWLGKDTIVTGGHATIFKHSENPKYLTYYTQTLDFYAQKRKFAKGAKVIDVSASDLAKINIPIPPLTEQNRIVGILDKFEELVNQSLPAEIEARRKQYEYYREKLLTFGTADFGH